MAWMEHSHALDNSVSSGKALILEPEVEGLKVQLRGIRYLIIRYAQWFCLKGNWCEYVMKIFLFGLCNAAPR